jgi:predicted ATPase
MRLLHYIEIENFKRFSGKQRIELEHPTVIIGPNNCGKTSAIQALALWSQAFKTWYGIRANSTARQRRGVPLNRLEIVSVPVQTTKYFWSNVQVRKGPNKPVFLRIVVGVEFEQKIVPLGMSLYNDGDDLVYCRVEEEVSFVGIAEDQRHAFMEYVSSIRVELLYPMSGLGTIEPVYQDKFIGNLMGQGKTAEVLRNLCLKVDNAQWETIQGLMRRLFQIDISAPKENAQGHIELYYSHRGQSSRQQFELAASGRGFQQMLLILAYLFSHPKSVLLIDEPDAHLEILRQKQMYVLLRDIASDNGSQIVLVTHSEVILDEAVERNLTLIREGATEDISRRSRVLNSLKLYGAENYVRAVDRGYVLYVEGNTDVDMLRAFAKRLNHPVSEALDDKLNSYYIQSIYPEVSLESELDRVEMGSGLKPKLHFDHLRSLLPDIRGLAILDNDGAGRQDRTEGGLQILFWRRYEAENYFVSPDLLRAYSLARYSTGTLFDHVATEDIDAVLEGLILERVFGAEKADFQTWKSAPADSARLIWDTKTERLKLSEFAEEFFRRLQVKLERPMLLRKGELHRLIEYVDPKTIAAEVTQKLDAVNAVLVGG